MTYDHKLPIPTKKYVEPSNCPISTGVTNKPTDKPPAKTVTGPSTIAKTAGPKPTEAFPYKEQLDTNGDYILFWKVNATHITFEVHVRTLGYVGFGLSPNGNMYPADVIIGWVKDGQAYFKVYTFVVFHRNIIGMSWTYSYKIRTVFCTTLFKIYS